MEADILFTLWTPNSFYSFRTAITPQQSGKVVLTDYIFIYVS